MLPQDVICNICDDLYAIILSRQPTLLRGRTVTPPTPVWAEPKDPLTTTTRIMDFCQVLQGRAISGVTVGASGVTVVATSVTGSRVTLTLQGGVDGVPARIEVRAFLADGTDEAAAAILPIIAQITLPEGELVPASLMVSTVGTTPGAMQIPVSAPAASSVSLRGTVLARNVAATDTVTWDVAATIKGFGTSGATMAQQTATQSQADTALQACMLSVTAGAALICTGVAGDTIAWVANVTWESA